MNDSNKSKRQKSNKYRVLPESSSLISIPSTLTNESSITLIGSVNQLTKRLVPDETGGDADDEKDLRDELIDIDRYYRYHHRMKEQSITSEEEDDEVVLSKNHRGMMDFMDRVSFLKWR